MIELQMTINKSTTIVSIEAIRIEGEANTGELCTYEIRVHNQKVSIIKCPYGSAAKLGIKMLEEYKKLSEDFINDLAYIHRRNMLGLGKKA